MLIDTLQKLDEKALTQLCVDRCPESITLDFKRDIVGTSDKDKHEFLKDASAMANAQGGDLVYGIDETSGTASGVVPIVELPDAIERRLRQVLESGVEPRLIGVRFHVVPVTGGHVLVVRIPASFDGPHRYLFNQHSRFVMRVGTHTTELDYDQLRGAFDRTASLADRARRFHNDRIAAIIAGKTWRPMLAGPTCVAQLVPIASMGGRNSIDVKALQANLGSFMFADWGGASCTLNLDGLVVHPGARTDGQLAYTQVFRSGAFEAVRHGAGLAHGKKLIHSTSITTFYRDAYIKFLAAAKQFNLSGPAILTAAMLNVEGYEFAVGTVFNTLNQAYADRTHLVLPESWLDSVDNVSDIDSQVRPMLDVLWQAFGVERCMEYTSAGEWKPRP